MMPPAYILHGETRGSLYDVWYQMVVMEKMLLLTCCVALLQIPAGSAEPCRGAHCAVPLRQNARTITAEVAQECGDVGCRLPHRARPPTLDGSRSRPSRQHMQPPSEFPDLGSTLGIQMICDVKPGSNEVPSDDSLVLQLHLARGQEKVLEELRVQQSQAAELQRQLGEQQSGLAAQQRHLLQQQQRSQEAMEQVKAQYDLLLDSLKQLSFHSLQRELEGQLGQLGAHMVAEASLGDAGTPTPGCSSCGPEEYCQFRGEGPLCQKCTVCPAGFFLVAQCTAHSDRICQDRDECLEIPNLCRDDKRCLNTPGGFRCQGMLMQDAAAGRCGHGYFYNRQLQECQACGDCDDGPVATPCTAVMDTVCATHSEGGASLTWAGDVVLPPAEAARGASFPSMQLHIEKKSSGGDDWLAAPAMGRALMRQHGLVWADYNLAVSHSCPSFVQVCLRLNNSEVEEGEGPTDEGRDLSGVRLEQREGKAVQSASVSAAFAVEPGQAFTIALRSAGHQCSQTGDRPHLYSGPAPALSLLWLSHDTGAVAMTAQSMASSHYHTNYRPTFRTSAASDHYVVTLTHDGRGVRFTEAGVVRFVLQQALYSMGQACVSEGFALLAYVTRNGTSGEITRSFQPGAHYRDTSISLCAAAAVQAGDLLTFQVLAPPHCNVRYFGDDSAISMLSLLWVPQVGAAALAASVSARALPTGAVRNKPLLFHQVTPSVKQLELGGPGGRDLVFRQPGSASVAVEVRLIHSCSLLKLALVWSEGARPAPLAQQVSGQMSEGSVWASVSLRASFPVRNGTAVSVTVDCVRGRINQIYHSAGGGGVSVLWVAV
ncbi:uncharacterized protein LOC114789284 [Denticeps clupeoides]|uniref:uncharacterized protein LOC114789284 n=1 Tax=Denticeps clupeoides TaxID=299321 RepID=UPI0010A32008|nr:uncharacterized protein LOC114789284 [Denticeps clupeoides]